MNKQPEMTAQTRANIMNAFWYLFQGESLAKISVRAVVETAGYNRSTFYVYFIDIDDLVNQVEAELLVEMRRAVAESLERTEGPQMIEGLVRLYEEKGEYIAALLEENGDPRFVSKVKEALTPTLDKSLYLDQLGIEGDYIREFGLSAILAVLVYWHNTHRSISADVLVQMIRNMLSKGIPHEISLHRKR